MSLGDFIKEQLKKREQRGKSPEFLKAINQEKAEFFDALSDLGKHTFEAGVTTLLKAPTEIFLKSFKGCL
jgi:hypothetical protein